jgi:hypothetical protein
MRIVTSVSHEAGTRSLEIPVERFSNGNDNDLKETTRMTALVKTNHKSRPRYFPWIPVGSV